MEFLCRKYTLCARYCGLQEISGHCFEEVHGPCNSACVGEEAPQSYNDRFDQALDELMNTDKTMLITGKGFTEAERSVVLIEAGRYKGHGMVPSDVDLSSLTDVKTYIDTGYDDQDIQAVILSHIARSKDKSEVILL